MDIATKTLYPVTPAKAKIIRAELSLAGVKGARVRQMPNGAARVVLASRSDRFAARDAFVMAGACTASGEAFTGPFTNNSWNGDVEIFIRFTEPNV